MAPLRDSIRDSKHEEAADAHAQPERERRAEPFLAVLDREHRIGAGAVELSLEDGVRSYAELGETLGMSASEVHAAVRRLIVARLIDDERKIRIEALRNFLIHGVPYAFPVSQKVITRGIPTAWAAPVLAVKLSATDQLPPGWPDPDGKVQGAAVEPLYSSVPGAARRNQALSDLLALVDALRIGRARERTIAAEELTSRLNRHVAA